MIHSSQDASASACAALTSGAGEGYSGSPFPDYRLSGVGVREGRGLTAEAPYPEGGGRDASHAGAQAVGISGEGVESRRAGSVAVNFSSDKGPEARAWLAHAESCCAYLDALSSSSVWVKLGEQWLREVSDRPPHQVAFGSVFGPVATIQLWAARWTKELLQVSRPTVRADFTCKIS